jgi:cytidylate kinase
MMKSQPTIIAIDGGAGTGTSTAARGVARELGLPHLNTGELYRGITYAVLQAGVDPHDATGCLKVTKAIKFDLESGNVVAVNGQDVRGKLHLEDVNSQVSAASSHPAVRDEIVDFQRDYARQHGVVMEGRDIGTRIFPDTPFKFFFICDPAERVRRVNAGGRSHETVQSLLERDEADSHKKVGAFKQAADAITIDTTNMDVAETVSKIVAAVRERQR